MNYLAHAGHDHMSELTNTSTNTGFVIGLIMLAVAALVVGVFAYDTLKNRKVKSKK